MLDRIGFGARSEFRGPLISKQVTTDPAANTEFSITVPAGEAWLILSATVNLVATIQTPWPALTIADSAGTTLLNSPAGTAAANAGVTAQYSWLAGGPVLGSGASTSVYGTLPNNLYVGPGFVIASLTAGIGANCNYGPAALLVVRYS